MKLQGGGAGNAQANRSSTCLYPHEQLLKELGANEHVELAPHGWTALTLAARHGHMDVILYLHRLDLSLGKTGLRRGTVVTHHG
jgi:ankyrin repeat protein